MAILRGIECKTYRWLTTTPNPRTSATGVDAGQRGWKLHAVKTASDSFKEISKLNALCGLRPAHGWSLDLFIDDRCSRCARIAATNAETA